MIEKDCFVDIIIYGFCDGYFGRDSYDDKLIIANGMDWLVVEHDTGHKSLANFSNSDEMWSCVSKWRIES